LKQPHVDFCLSSPQQQRASPVMAQRPWPEPALSGQPTFANVNAKSTMPARQRLETALPALYRRTCMR
jgi:hypothetical protein